MDFKKELEQILVKNNLISYTTEYVEEEIEMDSSNHGKSQTKVICVYSTKIRLKYV